MSKALIIFIKNPRDGNLKTRLAATVGNKAALEIYGKMVTHTNVVARIAEADKYVFYSSHIASNDEWNEPLFEKRMQMGDDLGERMLNAFTSLFNNGYEHVAIIGSDCPAITAALVDKAFHQLKMNDIVVGPATDGGYYLLALKRLCAELFQNISWSTSHVLSQTLAVCNNLNLSAHLLPPLSDVDVEGDILNHGEFFTVKKE